MALVDSFFVLLGGLGLFFYGMSQFSEALQSASSDLVKRILGSLTSNRVFGVLVGIGITAFVQSSSISTAMTVGFVNAGLLELAQGVSVIFGANIGTTITGWIISVKVSHLGLHFIGIGLLLSWSRKRRIVHAIGKIIFGLGLVFFGLETMSGVFKPLRTNPDFISYLHYFDAESFVSLMGTIMMGCFLTVIVQSSSAMLGITLALATSGVISFQTAVALVMGENIGTTITALLAAVGGNTNAKRAALAHSLFNLSAVMVLALIFHQWVDFVEWFVPGDADGLGADGGKPHIAYHIATSHSLFNVTATLMFLPFLNQFVRLVEWLKPAPAFKEQTRLMIPEGVDLVPSLAIEEAYAELNHMADLAQRVLGFTRDVLADSKASREQVERIHKYEDILDRVQGEILAFLARVMEEPLNHEQTVRVNTIITVAADLEAIGDYCRNLMMLRERLFEMSQAIDEKDFAVLKDFMDDVIEVFGLALAEIADPRSLSAHHFDSHFHAFKQKTKRFRVEFLRKANEAYNPAYDLNFSDMLASIRKINGHSGSINRAISHMQDHS